MNDNTQYSNFTVGLFVLGTIVIIVSICLIAYKASKKKEQIKLKDPAGSYEHLPHT